MGDIGERLRLLKFILAVDLLVTGLELAGWYFSRSLLLESNFGTGLYDAVLISLNIWGLRRESQAPQYDRVAFRIAKWSDIALAAGALVILTHSARGAMIDQGITLTRSWLIPVLGLFAGSINLGLAYAIDTQNSVNSQSARLKLFVGSTVGFGTGASGLVIYFFGFPKLDAMISAGIAIYVIDAVRRRIKQQKAEEFVADQMHRRDLFYMGRR